MQWKDLEHFNFFRLHPPEDSCGLTLQLPEVELHTVLALLAPQVGLKGGNVRMKRGGCPPQAWGSAPPAPSPSVSDSTQRPPPSSSLERKIEGVEAGEEGSSSVSDSKPHG